ncbi:MAG: hypothetical protein MUO76_02830 [Anaerolineaceae bacterium]|nr:hypothetical protein [Anaerolineaceae bacterium]
MPDELDQDTTEIYQIRVFGHLDQRWSDWFDGFALEYLDGNTILTGPVADQAVLHGALTKIRDLGLTILLVKRIKRDA